MQLSLGQQMKMSQQMKLAPRMIQSMEILQLPIMALKERVEQELIENIVLEQEQPETEIPDGELEAMQAEADAEANPIEREELVVDNQHDNEADFERMAEMFREYPDYLSSTNPSSNRIDDEIQRTNDAIANLAARPESLQESLLEQFRFFNCEAPVREFGEFIIQNLDANGRLPNNPPSGLADFNGAQTDPLQGLINVYGKPVDVNDAHVALRLVQRLEPRGVGAR